MVFYLKYRPKTLVELDNSEIAAQLGKYLSRASVPHAFLFTGPKGIGKTSAARIVAKSITCTKSKSRGIACGTCEICLSIGRGDHLDVLEIDAASNRGIDEIRNLREKIKLAPTTLSHKVYIIDEVHMLTTEAFNALLKTLEEPPSHAIFILATTEAHKVPETIKSRCVRVEFHRATTPEIVHSLSRVVAGEALEVEAGVLEEIAKSADGAFRDAAKILEEVATDKKITLETVKAHLGLVEPVQLEAFILALKEKKARELLEMVNTLSLKGKNVKQFFQEVLRSLEQKLIRHFETAGDWKKEELVLLLRLFGQSFAELKTAVIPTLPFELAIVEYCSGVSGSVPVAVASPPKQTVTDEENIYDVKSAAPLVARWNEFLEALKPVNHSLAGVMRSCRVLSLAKDTLVIEALYKFHAERLGDVKSRDIIVQVVKQMLGTDVKVEVVLKKR